MCIIRYHSSYNIHPHVHTKLSICMVHTKNPTTHVGFMSLTTNFVETAIQMF